MPRIWQDVFKTCPDAIKDGRLNGDVADPWARRTGLVSYAIKQGYPESPRDWTTEQIDDLCSFVSKGEKTDSIEVIVDYSNGNYFRVLNALMYNAEYKKKVVRRNDKGESLSASPPIRIAVYCALTVRANKVGQCWGSIKDVAELSGTSYMTAWKALWDLAALGLIRIDTRQSDGAQQTHLYTLLNFE